MCIISIQHPLVNSSVEAVCVWHEIFCPEMKCIWIYCFVVYSQKLEAFVFGKFIDSRSQSVRNYRCDVLFFPLFKNIFVFWKKAWRFFKVIFQLLEQRESMISLSAAFWQIATLVISFDTRRSRLFSTSFDITLNLSFSDNSEETQLPPNGEKAPSQIPKNPSRGAIKIM